jgi:hypothetical protein
MIRSWVSVVWVIALVACQPTEELHGDPATIRAPFEVQFTGRLRSVPLDPPSVSVARSPRDGKRIGRRIGIGEAARILRNWSDYEARALITVAVGAGPERGSRLRIDEVRTPALSSLIEVRARVVPASTSESSQPAVLWTILSISAGRVPPEVDCSLTVAEESTRTQCLPIAGDGR